MVSLQIAPCNFACKITVFFLNMQATTPKTTQKMFLDYSNVCSVEIICSITDLAASFLSSSAGISGEGDEDYPDKADAQSRSLWQD